jgi:hypothetical protein
MDMRMRMRMTNFLECRSQRCLIQGHHFQSSHVDFENVTSSYPHRWLTWQSRDKVSSASGSCLTAHAYPGMKLGLLIHSLRHEMWRSSAGPKYGVR